MCFLACFVYLLFSLGERYYEILKCSSPSFLLPGVELLSLLHYYFIRIFHKNLSHRCCVLLILSESVDKCVVFWITGSQSLPELKFLSIIVHFTSLSLRPNLF